MGETLDQQKSRFIATFRLKPSRSFAGLQAQINWGDYELSFQDDIVWIGFDATSEVWLRQLNVGTQVLKTVLAVLTIQTEYPFDLEPVQWIEDKPRNETSGAKYVLGRLGPDLVVRVQKEPPLLGVDHIRKGEIHVHLASHNAYYRYALLDYSVALSLPVEAIVFCARSVEWVESYFDAIKRSSSRKKGPSARELMERELKLPNAYLAQFFRIANDTVIARHAGDTARVRSPEIKEIRFCVFFNRVVLDRFGDYLWHLSSNDLPPAWKYPQSELSPIRLFEAKNSGLAKSLRQILSGELS